MSQTTLSLMVLPNPVPDSPPLILFDNGSSWRDMSENSTLSLTTIRNNIDAELQQMMTLVGGGNGVRFVALHANFKQYYQVISSSVRNLLRDAADAEVTPPILRLHIHPSVEWLPWELMHDGTDFLGLRFQIVRLPISSVGLNAPTIPQKVETVCSLLAENVLNAPEQAKWDNTFAGLLNAPIQQRSYPNGVPTSFPNLDKLMEAEDANILYLTCHGLQRAGSVYWTLNHQSQINIDYEITPNILASIKLQKSPLVFGNACASVGANGQGLAASFGTNFLNQGAANFIGTFAPITRTLAIDFAQRFYQHLLAGAGMTVGEALIETKKEYAPNLLFPGDPSYLFYSLYGPAEMRFSLQ